MTPSEILARIIPQWKEFLKTKSVKTFVVCNNPDCMEGESCNLDNTDLVTTCKNGCSYPLIDGKRIGFISDDGGFLIRELRKLFPEIGITEETFWELYQDCYDERAFEYDGKVYCEDCIFQEYIVSLSEKDAKESIDSLVTGIIEAVFGEKMKAEES